MTDLDPRTILATPMPEGNDAGAATIRDYLGRLLSDLWDEGEGFNGKRPFGSSGWEWELYAALAKAGHITGVFDQDGDVESADTAEGRALVADAIKAMPELLAEIERQRDHLDKVGEIHNGCPNTREDIACPWCRIAALDTLNARLFKGIQHAVHLITCGYTIQPRTALAELLREQTPQSADKTREQAAEVERERQRADAAEQQLRYLADLARTADHETTEAYIVHDSITDLINACKGTTSGGEVPC